MPSHKAMSAFFLLALTSMPSCQSGKRSNVIAMHIWGDRLINGSDSAAFYDDGGWETSLNGTWKAIDSIPRDIVICDWHYGLRDSYGSIPYFLGKGFRVIPSSYNDREAAAKLIDYSLRYSDQPRMLGHMYTTWCDIGNDRLDAWPPLASTIGSLR